MREIRREKAFDTAVAALSNPYRRQLLVALLEHNPQDDDDRDPLDLLSETEESTVLESELVHNHLPKLEKMGYITWDRPTNEISKGPKWDEIAPLLTLINDHQDELPDGWL
jgi:DNA-binding MarR family transcriptional regulator